MKKSRVLALGTVLSTLLVPNVAMSIPVTDGLVAYYAFDGATTDGSGNGHDATANGGGYTTGYDGTANGAYLFDGNDWLSTSLTLDLPQGTMAAWINIDQYDTGFNRLNLIFEHWDNMQFGLADSSAPGDNDGHYMLKLRQGSGFNYAFGGLAELNKWVHLAGTWDGTKMRLYVDGVEIAATDAPSPPDGSGPLVIGRHSHNDINFWKGAIDEAAIYDRALDSDEIARLARKGQPPTGSVPEPAPLLLLLFGIGLAGIARYKRVSRTQYCQGCYDY